MQISLNWLSDYITLNSSPEELAATLTRAGLEVEEIISTATVPPGRCHRKDSLPRKTSELRPSFHL